MNLRKSSDKFVFADNRLVILLAVAIAFSTIATVYFVRYLLKPNTGLVVNFPEVVYREGRVYYAPKVPFSPALSSVSLHGHLLSAFRNFY